MLLQHCWVISLGNPYLFSNKYRGELRAQMLCMLEDGWSVWQTVFCKWQHIDFLARCMAEEQSEREAAVYPRWLWKDSKQRSELHGSIQRRWKSPELNSQLSFEKLLGIIRGFSGKCDNHNLDWIIVEISAPFVRLMSREISEDPLRFTFCNL